MNKRIALLLAALTAFAPGCYAWTPIADMHLGNATRHVRRVRDHATGEELRHTLVSEGGATGTSEHGETETWIAGRRPLDASTRTPAWQLGIGLGAAAGVLAIVAVAVLVSSLDNYSLVGSCRSNDCW